MQISKKGDPKPQKSREKVIACPTAIIPYGRYINMTVAEVQKQDKQYWQWIESEGIIEKWLLHIPPSITPRKNYTPLRTAEGIWMNIYAVDQQGQKWSDIEDYIVNQQPKT